MDWRFFRGFSPHLCTPHRDRGGRLTLPRESEIYCTRFQLRGDLLVRIDRGCSRDPQAKGDTRKISVAALSLGTDTLSDPLCCGNDTLSESRRSTSGRSLSSSGLSSMVSSKRRRGLENGGCLMKKVEKDHSTGDETRSIKITLAGYAAVILLQVRTYFRYPRLCDPRRCI